MPAGRGRGLAGQKFFFTARKITWFSVYVIMKQQMNPKEGGQRNERIADCHVYSSDNVRLLRGMGRNVVRGRIGV
jgi:hypothetical protein